MKTRRTPEINYFESGSVEFSTSRQDGELYYQIWRWNDDRTARFVLVDGKVKDQPHLKELQFMENVKN